MRKGDQIEIRIERNLNKRLMDVFVLQDDGYVEEVKFTKPSHSMGTCFKPIVEIDDIMAQVLMDDLWNCGIRPTEGKGSAGSLTATENHLKDMRMIAFDQLGIDK